MRLIKNEEETEIINLEILGVPLKYIPDEREWFINELEQTDKIFFAMDADYSLVAYQKEPECGYDEWVCNGTLSTGWYNDNTISNNIAFDDNSEWKMTCISMSSSDCLKMLGVK